MRIVDSFTTTPFTGNPAAVVMLDATPPDTWLAAVARETNMTDTGFVIRDALTDADFRLRWFTPELEVDLCGHATLAAAHCLFEDGAPTPIRFASRSGVLTVARRPDGSLAMDFPAQPAVEQDSRAATAAALRSPVAWTGDTANGFFRLAVLADEAAVRDLRPEIAAISRLEPMAIIVTAAAAPASAYDFVSRLFAPRAGVTEDPVTGSSHTVLAPYWCGKLGRSSLVGLQVSSRPGAVGVELDGDRVVISGRAVTIFDGILRSAAHPDG